MWNREGWDCGCNLDFDHLQTEAVLSGASQALPLPLASLGRTKHCPSGLFLQHLNLQYLPPPLSPRLPFGSSSVEGLNGDT